MATLNLLEHHTVYRNPHPTQVSEYIAFPAMTALPDDTLLCMCRHGIARESNDGQARLHRSTDGGRTWSLLPPLPEPAGGIAPVVFVGGLGVTADGQALAAVRSKDSATGQSRCYLARSNDTGDSWTTLEMLDLDLYEGLASVNNLSSLRDGTLNLCGETAGDGDHIEKDHYVTLLSSSHDGGQTWEKIRMVHDGINPKYFDLRITAMSDGRWLAAYWTHDVETDQGLNVHFSISPDAGHTWSQPSDSGFWGQLTEVYALQSGRILAVTNHRRPPMGIRAQLSRDETPNFDPSNYLELWGIEPPNIRSAPTLALKRDKVKNVFDSYHYFTFGTPAITQLSDGTIVIAFYVTEESVTYVRCCQLVETD